MSDLLKIERLNGEIFYINMEGVTLAFLNPVDKSITLTGPGLDKIFRIEEVPGLVKLLNERSLLVSKPLESKEPGSQPRFIGDMPDPHTAHED